MLDSLGRHHPVLRRLRALRRDGALRRAEGVVIAEGLHLVREALGSPDRVEWVLASPKLTALAEGRELLQAIELRGLSCQWTTDELLEGVQDARAPQPVLALVRPPALASPAELLERGGRRAMLLAACDLQDPGNLGTLLRTAEAAGAQGCFVCGRSADPWQSRAVRASAGSILRLPIAETPALELLELARARQLIAVGADAAATTLYDECDFTRPFVLFVGAEGAGLPAALALLERVRVPMVPEVESLSVAAAAAVILFEAARQRRIDAHCSSSSR